MKKPMREDYNSPNLFNKLSLLTERQVSEIIDGIHWVSQNAHAAVIIGGVAIAHYLNNSRDLTPDIDFMVADMEDLKGNLNNANLPFKPIVSGNGTIGITVGKFNTDFLDSHSGNQFLNKLILETSVTTKMAGCNVKIITPELLAIMKIELGRIKDTDDGLSLISSGILNKAAYMKLVTDSRKHLDEYSFLLSYGALL